MPLILFLASQNLSAATPGASPDQISAARKAMDTYRLCVAAYANRFIKTTAAANEIADAAISTCEKDEQDAEKLMQGVVGQGVKPREIAEEVTTRVRRFVIALVLEQRYPIHDQSSP